MAAENAVRVEVGAREVHQFLRQAMSHVELVSQDAIESSVGDVYVGVLLYQQWFGRVGNQVALMLLVSGDSQRCTVKSVSCGSSRSLLGFDWGAAGDFAYEPIGLLQSQYRGKVYETGR